MHASIAGAAHHLGAAGAHALRRASAQLHVARHPQAAQGQQPKQHRKGDVEVGLLELVAAKVVVVLAAWEVERKQVSWQAKQASKQAAAAWRKTTLGFTSIDKSYIVLHQGRLEACADTGDHRC